MSLRANRIQLGVNGTLRFTIRFARHVEHGHLNTGELAGEGQGSLSTATPVPIVASRSEICL